MIPPPPHMPGVGTIVKCVVAVSEHSGAEARAVSRHSRPPLSAHLGRRAAGPVASLSLRTAGAHKSAQGSVCLAAPTTGLRVQAVGDGELVQELPSTSEGAHTIHWSDKISGGTARDDLRYMDTKALDELLASAKGFPWEVTDVFRDSDNVTLVADDKLILPFLAAELGCEEAEAQKSLERLVLLLPALVQAKGRLAKLGVKRLALLCSDTPALVQRLIQLKDLLPDCDVGTMASVNPFLLTDDLGLISEGLATLRELFPAAGLNGTPGVDRMAQAVPQLLDPDFTRKALDQLQLLHGKDAADMVHRNPKLILQVESSALRSRLSVSFDQTHVRRNKVIPMADREEEAYYST